MLIDECQSIMNDIESHFPELQTSEKRGKLEEWESKHAELEKKKKKLEGERERLDELI